MSKSLHLELPKSYEPKAIEERVYRFWEEGGFFTADATSEAYEPALKRTTSTFFGDSASFERVGGPREAFAIRISTGSSGSVDEALARA